MQVRDTTGRALHINVQVPASGNGMIYAAAGNRVPLALTPRDVSELRQIFIEAQAVAFRDRGGFE